MSSAPNGDVCSAVITEEPEGNAERLLHHLAAERDLRGMESQPRWMQS